MQLRSEKVEKIKAGEISVIFRRWKRPTVKAGGTQMTSRGVVAVDAVDVVSEGEVTEQDAWEAGFASKEELFGYLFAATPETQLYRIRVHFQGEDPRKALRENADISQKELSEIIDKLDKLDSNSQRGDWTQLYLQMIHDRPNTHAIKLARSIGLDIPTFKPWVRKLKALGLTESLKPGYRLSPRGENVLEALNARSGGQGTADQ
ncbi:MAG: ASCH domain-containing protein [Pyrinomonadaceae bacterium]